MLFFNTTGKPASHVGIYVGGGQMISAESGYGVHVTGVFSGAQSSYWKPLFEQARRVIGYTQPAAASHVSKSVSASSTSSSGTKTYSVKSGDTLWGISRHYGVSVSAIKSLNHLSSDTIYAGQKLSLNTAGQKSAAVSHSAKVSKKVATSTGQSSAKSSYNKVHKGDSLWEIATLHGITVNKLMKANNLSSTIIYPGMKLVLPN
ncbi:LysM peptidoglycan-binding domain-containing protein [Terrilactibacillus sp. S3-3]|nr:LysM peptidoglycan-binding domain-containing protein [Terrilactibacillus sp. S3-3]